MPEYIATIRSIHDGDTLTVSLSLGVGVSCEQTLRLEGINAPELNSAGGKAALAFVTGLVSKLGPACTVKTNKDAKEKYGRLLATVVLADGTELNKALLDSGNAVPYDGGKRAEGGADPEWLRSQLISKLDGLLGRPLLLWGDDRKLVQAVRSYAVTMTAEELQRLASYYRPFGETDMAGDVQSNIPEKVKARATAVGLDGGLLTDLWQRFGPIVVQILIEVLTHLRPGPAPAPSPMQGMGPAAPVACDHAECCRAALREVCAAACILSHAACCDDED
jgi:hypothetical protein